MLNSVELFAGAGGLALGLEQAGYDNLMLVEQDKHACNTLRHNFPKSLVVEADIRTVDLNVHPTLVDNVDLLTGGAPCQSFSYAGLGKGMGDTRGTLFHEFARFVKHCNPRVFLFENVKGMIGHDEGRTLETILQVFGSLGYVVQWELLKAVQYGVPQKRERLIIVGVREDVHKAKGDYCYPQPTTLQNPVTLRDALRNVPASPGLQYPENKKKVLDLVPPGGCWVDLPEQVARDYLGASYFSGGGKRGMARRLSWDEPCLTLTTSPAQKQTERCHPDVTRPLTVREYARVQTFPDNWVFLGPVRAQYKQIGNAVPVLLGKVLGDSIRNYIEDTQQAT